MVAISAVALLPCGCGSDSHRHLGNEVFDDLSDLGSGASRLDVFAPGLTELPSAWHGDVDDHFVD
ncbi:MAG: hypothetical protein LRZ88_06905, partial [Candidatus Cloacimonetes bacterium]|nr:hypothetical protein [Candidatus Cloacimonadota bacterium]